MFLSAHCVALRWLAAWPVVSYISLTLDDTQDILQARANVTHRPAASAPPTLIPSMASLADGSLPQTSSDYSTVSMNQGPTGNTSSAPQFGRQTAKAEMQARLRNQNAAVLARGKTPIVPTPALPAIVSSRAGRAVMPNPTQASASPLTQRQTQSAANADVPTGQVPIPLTAPSEKQRKVQVVNDLMLDALGECYREMRLHSRARLIGKGACGYVYSVESSGADLANRALCLKIFITEPHIAKAEYDLLRYAHALIKLGTPASVPQPYKFRHITEPACKGVVHAILMERIDDHAVSLHIYCSRLVDRVR